MGRSPIIQPITSDIGLRVSVPHECDGESLGAGCLQSTENERRKTGVEEHLSERNMEMLENMVIIALYIPA